MRSRFAPAALGTFETLFRPWMRQRINAIKVSGLPASLPADRPLLLGPNHVGWWDGSVLREVHRMLRPAAPIYTLMSKSELDRVPLLRLLGVVGMEGSSPRSVAEALRFLEARISE